MEIFFLMAGFGQAARIEDLQYVRLLELWLQKHKDRCDWLLNRFR